MAVTAEREIPARSASSACVKPTAVRRSFTRLRAEVSVMIMPSYVIIVPLSCVRSLQGDYVLVTRIPLFGCCLLLLAAVVIGADEKPPRIKPQEARQNLGKKVEVVFEVKGSKHSLKRKTVYLDSEVDFRDEKNLGIQISEKGVSDLKQKRNVDEPSEFYRGKMIRVLGEIVIEDERPYIKVEEAEQLDLFAEKAKE
jgi:hypothetical protein